MVGFLQFILILLFLQLTWIVIVKLDTYNMH